MKPSYRLFFLATTVVVLAGCTGMKSDFACSATAGNACTRVAQVNALAEAGAYDPSGTRQRILPVPNHRFSNRSQPQRTGYRGVTPMLGEPVRSEGRLQRIWIAPYQDQVNNYHEPSYIYTVLEKPHWIGAPVHANIPSKSKSITVAKRSEG